MKFLVCSRLSEHRYKTPEGYLVCVDSILSRTGKQTYSRDELFKDGCNDEVEVERSAEEVFSEKTLASFENKPLTIEHPEEDVTPANHNKYSVGFIRDIKRGKDGSEDVMLGTIVVTDAEAIELIETGKLKELSCGYDCDIEDEDNPQQRNIRGNHVALCEKGRAGIARIVDSVKDATFEVWYVDRHDNKQQTFVIANDQKEARQKVQKIYGPYRIYEVRKVKDGVKDMKVSHDNIREQPVFVMQSDVDKNLFFYIGKTHAMKEGEWTYVQYDMEGKTPDELRKELEANGWHKVAKGPAPFIDEDPYEESTEGLEEAEKNLHDEMICNTETDCKDAKYRVGQNVLYHGKKSKILKIEHDERYGYDLLIVNPEWDGKDKRFENVWVGEDVKTIDACKDASDNAYRKVQTILSKNPQFKGKINKDEFDTGEIMIDFADYRNADKFVAECKRVGLRCREGYFGPDTTILVRDAATKDAKTEYVFNYRDTYQGTRDKMRVDANNLDEAIRKFGDTMALGGFGTANIFVVSVSPNDGYMRAYGKLSEMLKQKWTRDSVKDSTYKVEYISSGAEMYPIVEVDAASESEAIETVRKKDKKFVRLISVKKKDSVKKLDSKKLLSIVKAIDVMKTADRLAPSQYKALRELGYDENKWKNMTSEEASKIIAAAKKKKEGKSEKKEETKVEKSKTSKTAHKSPDEHAKELSSKLKELLSEADVKSDTVESVTSHGFASQAYASARFTSAAAAKRFAQHLQSKGIQTYYRNGDKYVDLREWYDPDIKEADEIRSYLNEEGLDASRIDYKSGDDRMFVALPSGVPTSKRRRIAQNIASKLNLQYSADGKSDGIYLNHYGEIIVPMSSTKEV